MDAIGGDIAVSVSEFVSLLNGTLEYAFPSVIVTGELANFRVSKNRWVYFDLKDEQASVKFFGTVYQMPGPLEDGMLVAVQGVPRLHPLYGFSVTVQQVRPAGEGSGLSSCQLVQLSEPLCVLLVTDLLCLGSRTLRMSKLRRHPAMCEFYGPESLACYSY